MKIFTRADVPDELTQAWLQHLRDFDTAHLGCHFEVMMEGASADMPMAKMIEALQINPGLSFQAIFERGKE